MIKEIRERVGKASVGPWLANQMCVDDPLGLFYGIVSYDEKRDYQRGGYPVTGKHACLDEDDASFIAHAREDIPYLLGLVEGHEITLAHLQKILMNPDTSDDEKWEDMEGIIFYALTAYEEGKP